MSLVQLELMAKAFRLQKSLLSPKHAEHLMFLCLIAGSENRRFQAEAGHVPSLPTNSALQISIDADRDAGDSDYIPIGYIDYWVYLTLNPSISDLV